MIPNQADLAAESTAFHPDVVPETVNGTTTYTLKSHHIRYELYPVQMSWTGPNDEEFVATAFCIDLTDRNGNDLVPVIYGLTGTEAAIADFLRMHGNYIRESGRDDEDLRIYHELIDDIDDNLRRYLGYDPRTETHASVRLELGQ